MRGSIIKRGSGYSCVLPLGRDETTSRKKQKWVSGFRTKREVEAAVTEAFGRVQSGQFAVPDAVVGVRDRPGGCAAAGIRGRADVGPAGGAPASTPWATDRHPDLRVGQDVGGDSTILLIGFRDNGVNSEWGVVIYGIDLEY